MRKRKQIEFSITFHRPLNGWKFKKMKIYIEFYDSLEELNKNIPGLGITEVSFTPIIGDEITLTFPSIYLKNNKWFNHIPDKPWKIESVFNIENGNIKALAYYIGTEKVNFRQIKNKTWK